MTSPRFGFPTSISSSILRSLGAAAFAASLAAAWPAAAEEGEAPVTFAPPVAAAPPPVAGGAPPIAAIPSPATTVPAAPATPSETIAGSTSTPARTIAGIQISALVDAYASFNPARGSRNGGPSELHAFDAYTNDLSFSYAELALERTAEPVGFRIDLGFGPTADLVNATDAASGMGYDLMRNVQQAYLVWRPSGRVTLRVGKMVTIHGFEVIETNANWNYTHGLLFTWAIPFSQTGLGVTWSASERLDLSAYVVNGLNNTLDGNDFKSLALQAAVRPVDGLTIIGNYQVFNELDGEMGEIDDFDNALHLLDAVVTYAATGELTVAAQSDLGYDLAVDEAPLFFDVGAWARYATSGRTALSLRAEYFFDGASPTLGILGFDEGQVIAATSTFTYSPADELMLRAEARVDQALGDFEPFTDAAGMPTATQLTFTLGAVAAF